MNIPMLQDAVLLSVFDFNTDMTVPVVKNGKGTVNLDDIYIDTDLDPRRVRRPHHNFGDLSGLL